MSVSDLFKGIAVASGNAAGVALGETLMSDVLSEKITFPFRPLKSDMIVFLAMCLSFGYRNHKGHSYSRNQNTCDCQEFGKEGIQSIFDAGDDAGRIAYGISA